MRVSYAIVFVSDMPRAVAFYRDVIGLPLRFESPEWTEFATEGAALALHIGDAGDPALPGGHRTPSGSCQPGLSVPDLTEFHQRMLANNVTVIQEPTDLHGTRLAQYADPDGLMLSVSEERR